MILFAPFRWLGARPYYISALVVLLMIGWMASGGDANESTVKAETVSKPLVKVEVQRLKTELVMRSVTLYGRSEPNRQTTIRAEVSGQIDRLYAKRGARVTAGEKISGIEPNNKPQLLTQMRSLLRQREIEYKGSLSLSQQGYQGKVRLAEAEAARDAAKAQVSQLELDLKNTTVITPYQGIMNERFVELGDYVAVGDPIAMVTDIDPLVVRCDATETDISHLKVGQTAWASFVDGSRHEGVIRYISTVSDPATNTFRVEVELPNADLQLFAGVSVRVEFPLEEIKGLKATAALLAIDDDGTLGIKTVIADNRVKFTPIRLIGSDKDGVWLSGFDDEVDVITVGQGFVREGDKVEVSYRSEKAGQQVVPQAQVAQENRS